MPKTNDETGASYEGHEGVVSHADGRLSEVNPERNLDGSLIDGDHPNVEAVERDEPVAEDDDLRLVDDAPAESEEKEEKSSPGISSSTSNANVSKKPSASAKTGR